MLHRTRRRIWTIVIAALVAANVAVGASAQPRVAVPAQTATVVHGAVVAP